MTDTYNLASDAYLERLSDNEDLYEHYISSATAAASDVKDLADEVIAARVVIKAIAGIKVEDLENPGEAWQIQAAFDACQELATRYLARIRK